MQRSREYDDRGVSKTEKINGKYEEKKMLDVCLLGTGGMMPLPRL